MRDWQLGELGYIVIGMADIGPWRRFAPDILGAMVADAPQDGLYVRLDEYSFRILVVPAARDGFVAAGWVIKNEAAFAAACSTIRSSGLELLDGTAEEIALRQAQAMVSFIDPSGNGHELCWGRTVSEAPFVSPHRNGRFLEGRNIGFGHAVLPSGTNFDESIAFWTDVCGLGLSDFTALVTPAGAIRVYFLHGENGRQHSLAMVERPSPAGIFHMMVEARDLDAVGGALDRVLKSGAPLARSLGRHVNDEVVSFYVMAPGGIMIEYGCSGKIIDPATHVTNHIPRGSHWGHIWQPGFDPRSG